MMKKSGINMGDVKASNRSQILNQIKNNPKSRKDIANSISLTPAAVTILVNELLEQGCVIESGQVNEPTRVGRKKVLIDINKDYRYAIGVDIESNSISIGIGNLKAEILINASIEIDGSNPVDVLTKIGDKINALIDELGISKKDVLGIGVGIVGLVDSELGVSKQAYGIWKEEVNIEEIISQMTGLSVVVENNVRALAMAEINLSDNADVENMMFLKLGPGIGSAIILDQEIYRGSYNVSSEIGHMIVDVNGKECRCGQKGCFETVASIASLIEDIKADYSSDNYPILYGIVESNVSQITEELVVRAYENGDVNVIKKLDQLISYLSIGVVNIFKLYDPSKIAIYGKMFKVNHFLDRLINEIDSRYKIDDLNGRIVKSNLSNDKSIGGIVVIRDRFLKSGGILL